MCLKVDHLEFCNRGKKLNSVFALCVKDLRCTTHIANIVVSLPGIILTRNVFHQQLSLFSSSSSAIAGSGSLNKWPILGIIHRLIGNPRDTFNLKLETEINIKLPRRDSSHLLTSYLIISLSVMATIVE